MKFKQIENNTNWNQFKEITSYNLDTMGNLKIPIFLKRSYSKLITVYPFDEKKEKTYFNLISEKRLPFLFNYLIKICNKNNIPKSLIINLFKLKKIYENKKLNIISKKEKDDMLKINIISKNYDNILNLHLNNNTKNEFDNLINYTNLLINSLIDKYILKIKTNTKEWKKINNINENYLRNKKRKKSSLIELRNTISNNEKDINKWELYIETEVKRRINNKMTKKYYFDEQYGKSSRIEDLQTVRD